MAVPENFPEGPDDDLHYEYEATLLVPQVGSEPGATSTWRLDGKWRTVTGAEMAAAIRDARAAAETKPRGDSTAATSEVPKVWHGTFSCKLAAGDTSTVEGMGGLFLGEAVPAAALAGSVPRNPINWCLAALPARDGAQAAPGTLPLVGAGYFDDSGDFVESPVLFYYLHGSLAPDTGRFTLDKIYERKTGGMKVSYTGEVVSVSGAGDAGQASRLVELKGEWANIEQQTFGVFGCRQEAQQGTMPAPSA